MEIENKIYNHKPISLLIHIYLSQYIEEREKIITDYAKEIGCFHSSIYMLISKLFKLGLIKKRQENRKKIITLTEKGKEVAKRLYEIHTILSQD